MVKFRDFGTTEFRFRWANRNEAWGHRGDGNVTERAPQISRGTRGFAAIAKTARDIARRSNEAQSTDETFYPMRRDWFR